MNQQELFNIAVGLVGLFGGYFINGILQSLKEFKEADIRLAEKVNKIEILVAGDYVTRQEHKSLQDAIFTKLDRIEDKIDMKADKP